MIREVKCKFCQKSLHLIIDDEYGELGDPYKLLQKAACGPCADFRYRLRRLTDVLEQVAYAVRFASNKPEREKLSEKAEALLKAYVRLASENVKAKTAVDWDPGILENFMAQPDKVGNVIAHIWAMVRNAAKQEELALCQTH